MSKSVTVPCDCCENCPPEPECPNFVDFLVDPEGDPCQLFGGRVTTTIVDRYISLDSPCDPENGDNIYRAGYVSIYSTTTTTESCEQPTTTNQSGSSSYYIEYGGCGEGGGFFFSDSCSSTLTNDGWRGFINGEPMTSPCLLGVGGTTTVTYSDPIERCCDGYAPVGPDCECVYTGG